jgi:hypothetical protein
MAMTEPIDTVPWLAATPCIDAFYASGVGRNRPNPISRLAIRLLIVGATRRVRRLRIGL